MTSRSLTAALFAAAVLSVLGAAPALASRSQESFIEDEHQMLQLGPDARNRALDDAAALGADGVRVVVQWRTLAPDPEATRRPRGFKGSDPAAYAPAAWDPLDELVRGAQARGLKVLLTPSGQTPAWASRCRTRRGVDRHTCKPDASLYGAFVRALGTRYAGAYADESGGGALPRVGYWSFWNEPNQPGWLTPQYEARGGRAVPVAASTYRGLARAGLTALRATGHGRDVRLLGETAPLGDPASKCRGRSGSALSRCLATRKGDPTTFVRGLLCLDAGGRRLTGAAASALGCRPFQRLSVTGYAHHPYTRGGGVPPTTRPTTPGEITIGTGARLHRLLDQGARARRIPRRLPIFYTESGFQTNPPDAIFGVRLPQQAEYLNQSDLLAYRDRRVRSMSQYIIVDEIPTSSFQSGLRDSGGAPKPSYDAWRTPLWVVKHGTGVRVWGQLRPLADGATAQVDVQRAPDGTAFASVRTVTVASRKGFFSATIPGVAGGSWRLVWTPPGGAALQSRVADVAPR